MGRDIRTEWELKDVMEYFGEYLNYDERAVRGVMLLCQEKYKDLHVLSFNMKMHSLRKYLVEEGLDIPFVTHYRRVR